MYIKAEQRLNRLLASGQSQLLQQGQIGLEKENLRVSTQGCIARTPHPKAFGSPLTHPFLTTDYSEALTEFVTPPCASIEQALAFLDNIQTFAYQGLDDEFFWSASMPCVIEAGQIPIASYGSSNLGQMKTVYRRGLGYRYGHRMQVIAGIHVNYSLHPDFWPVFQQLEHDRRSLTDIINHSYFAILRNLQRLGWLVPYLFGASPAVCRSFVAGKTHRLQVFDPETLYLPEATSLRMGDIGYQNSQEAGTGVKACYDHLDAYLQSLSCAIATPCPLYEQIGVCVDGHYRQLSANRLQIENEYYSTVRPKQPPQNNEPPIHALATRGVQYLELRSVDLNPFEPLGVSATQLRFLETLILFCLFLDSPHIDADERAEIDRNQIIVAHTGRKPALMLSNQGQDYPLHQWASEILQAMETFCEVLDQGLPDAPYRTSLRQQQAILNQPEQLPSARILKEMRQNEESFFDFAHRWSFQHRDQLKQQSLLPAKQQEFVQLAQTSWQKQAALEAEDTLTFAEYLAQYYRQAKLNP